MGLLSERAANGVPNFNDTTVPLHDTDLIYIVDMTASPNKVRACPVDIFVAYAGGGGTGLPAGGVLGDILVKNSGTDGDASFAAPAFDAAVITGGTINFARLPTGTSSSQVSIGNHSHAFADLASTPTTLGGYGIGDAATASDLSTLASDVSIIDGNLSSLSAAFYSHMHSGADITSGTVGFAYLPTGTGSSHVAIGDHTHAYNTLTSIPANLMKFQGVYSGATAYVIGDVVVDATNYPYVCISGHTGEPVNDSSFWEPLAPQISYPTSAEISPASLKMTTGGTYVSAIEPNCYAKMWWYIVPHTLNDELQGKFYLGAGSYTMRLWRGQHTDFGIATIQIDGVTVATVDAYGALTYSIMQDVTGVSIGTNGTHTISIKVTSKNGSSTGYGWPISWISFF